MESLELKYFVMILPMALFYLAILLKLIKHYIKRQFSKEGMLYLQTIPSGSELSLMSISLDIAVFLKNIVALETLQFSGSLPITTVVPALLFIIHLLLYIISAFIDIKVEQDYPKSITKMLGMTIGLFAIFTNSWTIEMLINR